MQGNHIPMPISIGAYVSTVANVGGFEGIGKHPTIEVLDESRDGWFSIHVEHMGAHANLCFPDAWWDTIEAIRVDARGRRAAVTA